MQETLNADNSILCLSWPGRKYWRHEVLPSYKEHRSSGEPPLVLSEVKKFLREEQTKYTVYCRPLLEGDDCLGILATHPTLVPGERIICSGDKDLRSVPGLLYNPRKPDEGVQEITETQADRFFYTQALTGDPCDGYKGCPRIGPKKAEKIIAEAEANGTPLWTAIVAAYVAKGLDESHALTQARVARILRFSDYDFKERKPILWEPSKLPS